MTTETAVTLAELVRDFLEVLQFCELPLYLPVFDTPAAECAVRGWDADRQRFILSASYVEDHRRDCYTDEKWIFDTQITLEPDRRWPLQRFRARTRYEMGGKTGREHRYSEGYTVPPEVWLSNARRVDEWREGREWPPKFTPLFAAFFEQHPLEYALPPVSIQ